MGIGRILVAGELQTEFEKMIPAGTTIIKKAPFSTYNLVEYTVDHPEIDNSSMVEGDIYPLITPIISRNEIGALVWVWNDNKILTEEQQ